MHSSVKSASSPQSNTPVTSGGNIVDMQGTISHNTSQPHISEATDASVTVETSDNQSNDVQSGPTSLDSATPKNEDDGNKNSLQSQVKAKTLSLIRWAVAFSLGILRNAEHKKFRC